MPLSRYIKIYPDRTDRNTRILFSTKTAAAIQASDGLIEDIEKDGLIDEEKESLRDLGFLVPGGEQEEAEMRGFIRELNTENHALSLIVVLNLDCNLACKYCFEGLRKGKHYLSDDVEDQLVDFVKKIDSADKDEIRVTFYGGEPLLSVPRIESISKKLLTFAERKVKKYSFSLVTNGTLLSPAFLDRLLPLGLTAAKVTLDGPQDVHDRFRPFKNGAGSFDVIVKNVADACGRIRIQVGGNYTRSNYREFPGLLDRLVEAGITPARIPVVKFDPVMNESGEFALPDFHDGCDAVDEPWLTEAALLLREEVLRRGFRQPKILPSPCVMQLDHSFVVNYDGALYKCPGLIGREECRVGDVAKGARDCRAALGLDDWQNEECLACPYLPLCFGGCKYAKLVSEGALRGVNCRKRYYDAALEGLVSQDVRYDL